MTNENWLGKNRTPNQCCAKRSVLYYSAIYNKRVQNLVSWFNPPTPLHLTLVVEDIVSNMVQIKFFEASSLRFLEVRVNEFLEGIDKKNIINVSIATSEQENVHPSKANYIAAILYDESNEEILE